ncbi:MAG: type I 3-dehydroquinate dehydratase, partial [Candidatus Acinetobacter avistercoris]|nr:type I 3-dehydroquinate dehydratase [Candidatus Acinetobacter avistercoris]
MIKVRKIAMQFCLSSAVLAAMPAAFAVEVTPATQHYMVKSLNIGDLPVKTIVPITAVTAEQAIAQAQVIASNPNADVAEFRIDLLEFSADTKKVILLGQQLNQILQEKPLIATIRTHNEGGKMTVSDQDYEKIYREYLKKPFMQLLDIEMFRNAGSVAKLTKLAHDKKVL